MHGPAAGLRLKVYGASKERALNDWNDEWDDDWDVDPAVLEAARLGNWNGIRNKRGNEEEGEGESVAFYSGQLRTVAEVETRIGEVHVSMDARVGFTSVGG